jgi:hypothetical protein
MNKKAIKKLLEQIQQETKDPTDIGKLILAGHEKTFGTSTSKKSVNFFRLNFISLKKFK